MADNAQVGQLQIGTSGGNQACVSVAVATALAAASGTDASGSN